MKTIFRIVALLEGVSYIALLLIAVPIKYWGGDEQWVKLLGMPHGLLFIAYIILAYLLENEENWEKRELFFILTASLIPFGTFYVDKKYLRKK
tara:strand:- start:144 stop:422 length:279 start_codon:yes stop_codon:yes gene_type:complete